MALQILLGFLQKLLGATFGGWRGFSKNFWGQKLNKKHKRKRIKPFPLFLKRTTFSCMVRVVCLSEQLLRVSLE